MSHDLVEVFEEQLYEIRRMEVSAAEMGYVPRNPAEDVDVLKKILKRYRDGTIARSTLLQYFRSIDERRR